MNTVIITDSTCDIDREILQQMNVEMIPLTVLFGDESFKDGIDLTKNEFFEKLASSAVNPTTSQPAPELFLEVFNKYKAEGKEIVYIGISSVLSGTIQSAKIAKEMCDYDKIYVVDSLSATSGLDLLVRVACDMREKGETAKAIAEHLEQLVPKLRLYAYVDTLKYLVRGGRVSKVAGAIGGALGVKPLITIADGAVISIGTARGQKLAFEKLCSIVKEADIDTSLPMVMTNSVNEENMFLMEAYLQENGIDYKWNYSNVGSVIGTHIGPGAVAVTYFVK